MDKQRSAILYTIIRVMCLYVLLFVCLHYYAPPLIGGDIKQCVCLTSVCLSRTSGLSREQTERPKKNKIGTEVAHVTPDSDTTFNVKRSRLPGRFTHRGLNAWGRCGCIDERGNVLGVGNYCYVAVCSAALGASAPTEGREGRGIPQGPSAYSLFILYFCRFYISM